MKFGCRLLLPIAAFTANLEADEQPVDFSLDELVDTPVIQTSKGNERIFDTPVSSFIFDEEALTFLPVDSIPEMLRYAPGIQVLRSSNGAWSLGIRGYNSRTFSRVLVSVDEQNIYASLFSGLFGNQHDLPFGDIESIEIVYGPGGSLWGSSAVNGMVNIVQKSAFETEGSFFKARAGTHIQQFSARTGWQIDNRTSARIWTRAGYRKGSNSGPFSDDWESYRAGLQVDRRINARNLLTINADFNASYLDNLLRVPNLNDPNLDPVFFEEKNFGATSSFKWQYQKDRSNGFTLQGWIGYTDYESFVDYDLSIGGFEFRGKWSPAPSHSIFLRADATHQKVRPNNTDQSSFLEEADDTSGESSLSIEYSYEWIPDKIKTAFRLNFTYNSLQNEIRIDPYANLIYTPNEWMRLWFSAARAGRSIPEVVKNIERIRTNFGIIGEDLSQLVASQGFVISPDQPILINLIGSDDNIDNEEVTAFEAGARIRMKKDRIFSFNAYYFDYDQMMDTVWDSFEISLLNSQLLIEGNFKPQNGTKGYAYGGEISLDLQISPSMRMLINYAYLKDSYSPNQLSDDLLRNFFSENAARRYEAITPLHKSSIWFRWAATSTLRWDLGLRLQSTEGYLINEGAFQADTRVSWKPSENWLFSIVGRNLLDGETNEGILLDTPLQESQLEREVYLEIRWQF